MLHMIENTHYLPSGKLTYLWTITCLTGKETTKGTFSIANCDPLNLAQSKLPEFSRSLVDRSIVTACYHSFMVMFPVKMVIENGEHISRWETA